MFGPSFSEAQCFVNSEGAVWELIRRTEAHREYKQRYSLRSGEEGWVSVRQPLPTGSDGGDAEPQLVGLDCEMGQTTGAPRTQSLSSFWQHVTRPDALIGSLHASISLPT